MARHIIHVDMDAFYASVEQRDDPALRGRPVIVGAAPDARGVVAAASYEARAYGVHSAMPSSQARRRCPQAVFLPVAMPRYREASQRVMAILGTYTPLVEPISLDEAFLDVTGSTRLFGEAPEIGRQIKARILDEVRLVASVGVAASKFVAKVASDVGKPDGFVVVAAGCEDQFLAPLPISRLWGVGKAVEQRLKDLGVRTVGQLAGYPRELLERHFGTLGAHLHSLAHGLDTSAVEPARETKSVSAEVTYQHDTRELDLMERTLLRLAGQVGARLRHQGLRARTIQIKVRFEDFVTITRHRTLPVPTDANQTLYATARELLHLAPLAERAVRLLGIGCTHFGEPAQASLFEQAEGAHSRLDEAVDEVCRRFGAGKLRPGRLLGDDTSR